MILMTHSDQPRHQGADFIGEPATLGLRKVTADGGLGARRQMIAQHITLHAPERGDASVNLVSYLNAVALTCDHLLQTAHLPFDAPQARQLFGVIDRHTAVDFLGTNHLGLLPPCAWSGGLANGGALKS